MIRRVGAAAAVALLSAAAAHAGVETAMSAFKAGRYHEAAAEFQTLVEDAPGYDFGWFMLGHSLVKMHRPADGEAMFRRALHLAPGRIDYRHGLAIALKDQGQFQSAIAVLDAAEPLALDKRAIFALHALRGYLRVKVGAWSAAVVDLEKARRILVDPDLLDLLAQAYVGLFQFEKATTVLRDTLGAYPDRPDTMRLLTETLLVQAQSTVAPAGKRAFYAEALARARRLTVLQPEDPEARYLLGRAALGAGQLDIAESAFTLVLERDPRQCYVMINLARVRMARQAWASAEALLRKAAACAPRLGAVYETLGSGYLQQGRWNDAAVAFQRAGEVQPSPFSQAGLAEALRRLGEGTRPVTGPVTGQR